MHTGDTWEEGMGKLSAEGRLWFGEGGKKTGKFTKRVRNGDVVKW